MWRGEEHMWPGGMGSSPPPATPPPIKAASQPEPPRPPRPRDERAERWAEYAAACKESGTPQEKRFAYDFFRSLAQREQYFKEAPKPGPPLSLPQPHPRAPGIAKTVAVPVGDGGDKPCSLGDIKIRR
jgi:hypothetical protein